MPRRCPSRCVRWVPWILLAVVSVAGCSGAGEPASSLPSLADAARPAAANATEPTHSFATSGWITPGSIPYGAWLCDDAATHQCPAVAEPAEAWGWQGTHEAHVGNVTGGHVTLSWTATSTVTQSMTLGVQVRIKDCAVCPATSLGPDIQGASPLRFTIPAGVSISPNSEVHVWVYGGPYQSAGPMTLGVSGQQDFTVEASLSTIQ